MTWQDLRGLDCDAVRTLGDSWKSYSDNMIGQSQRLRDEVVKGHLGTDYYESDTADLVREQIGLTADRFEDDLSDYATIRLSTGLLEVADALEAEQNELTELIPLIESHDFEIAGGPAEYDVNMSGELHRAILTTNPPQWLCDMVGIEKPDGFFDLDRLKAVFNGVDLYGTAMELADQYQDWLRAVMSRAHDADDDAAAALAQMRENPAELPPQFGETYDELLQEYKSDLSSEVAGEMRAIAAGESGLSPGQVNEWWDGLSEAEREALIAEHPELVGPVDGIPVESRDTANRTVLDRDISGLDSRIAAKEDQLAGLDPDSDEHQRLQEEIDGLKTDRTDLARLQDRITDDDGNPETYDETGQSYYLLDFATEGSGQAVVSIGNPDTADNVNAYVPGTGGGIAGAGGGLMNRAETMAADAQDASPDTETATVLWMGYDAPDDLLQATDDKWAEQGSDELESFTEGVRASAEGEAANLTLTGHSYGSTMVGTAAVTEGVDADNMLFIGSPGVGTDTADALGAQDVYATRNDSDVIQYGTVHGTDPVDGSFGADTIHSDVDGKDSPWYEEYKDPIRNHSSYWDDTNLQGREDMADVVTGRA
ncbi:alpha/beta hydrolase [Glycomyces buryatensis]|nr:alpha/beta hydrolase [Glycomyces buryatensis]